MRAICRHGRFIVPRQRIFPALNARAFHRGSKLLSVNNASVNPQRDEELKTVLNQLHDARQLQLTATESLEILNQLRGAFAADRIPVDDLNEKNSASFQKWLRLWNGRGFFDKTRGGHDLLALEGEASRTFLELVQSDPVYLNLRKFLSGQSLKNLAALGNLLYQMDSSYHGFAIALWEYGAIQKERNCLYSLAQLFQNHSDEQGHGNLLAAALYRQAAEQQHPYAVYNLGMMFASGAYGVIEEQLESGEIVRTPDHTSAVRLLSSAMDLGAEPAITNLANMYRLGLGVDPDLRRAVDLYEKAAELNDPKAKFTLANLYATGLADKNGFKIVANPSKAFNLWYEAAAIAQKPAGLNQVADANVASCSFYNIGNCYFLGLGLPDCDPDSQEYHSAPQFSLAIEFWELATQLDSGNLRAWLQLGNIYFDGIGIKHKNHERALFYYQNLLENAHGMDNNDSIESEAIQIATQLANICQKNLSNSGNHLTKESYMPGKSNMNDLLSDAASGKFKLSNPFSLKRDQPDFEKRHQNQIETMAKQKTDFDDAYHKRWKYVEDFGSQMNTSVVSNSSKPASKPNSDANEKCVIM